MEFLPFLKPFADALFKLATIRRWNDHPRPFEITELDKQGHKAIVAYLFAKIEEHERGKKINWRGLVEGLIFEALQRALLTDLKPRVFHKLVKTRRREINEYLFKTYGEELKEIFPQLEENFRKYFSDDSYLEFEKHIIGAAHFVPTYWEFQFIYPVAKALYGIERTREEIENTLEDYHHLIGIQRFLLKRKLYGFINRCGQLRFQKRWISVERIPQTSVMGHIFTVFVITYLLLTHLEGKGFEISLSSFYATTFTALFHDLAEIITRDIISPLKEVLGKEEIRRLEVEGLENEILPLLPSYIADEIRLFLGIKPPASDEFADRWVEDNSSKILEPPSAGDYTLWVKNFLKNTKGFPIFGSLVKFADNLSALWEVEYTFHHGLRNEELEKAHEKLSEVLSKSPLLRLVED